ncbi:MAG: acyltransferase [Muribaculaceae bacterium]|nr:acyltransferase [Muribaculaceae bacterium]MDE7097428.1 acyltransferase [Muribaculaceae bacterium]
MNCELKKDSRLRYIDAMRGLAILLVVFSHVTNAYVKFPITNASFSSVYYMMTMFRMPLFFFVSGFFSFRLAEKWTFPTVKRVMTKKFRAQIVGLAVFSFIYGVCIKNWNFKFLWTTNPYWFTISLFEMFIIYLAVALIVKKTGSNLPLYILLGVSFAATFIFNSLTAGYSLLDWAVMIQVKNTLSYMPYFMLGIFARRFESFTWKTVDNQYFKALMILSFFLLVIFYGCRHSYSLQWNLVATAMRFSGLMTILIFFRTYRLWFDKGTPASNAMSFVGSRTLDIYYLHYLFIPNLSFMKGFFYTGPGNSIVAMLTVGLLISVIVVALCLLISAVLRTSPFLASWLFGASMKPAQNPVPELKDAL